MILGGIGGANTKTGLHFEKRTNLTTLLNSTNGYEVKDGNVLYEGTWIAEIYSKHKLYTFLKDLGIDWTTCISKQILPDDGIYVRSKSTFFVIECKFQQTRGSVDEKLQTCDFKKKQYQKLFFNTGIDVEYIYILNDYFNDNKYKDVLNYICSVGCDYFFNVIPLTRLGLPVQGNIKTMRMNLKKIKFLLSRYQKSK